ncbi:MAG: CopG family transcriptional regulator [Gemmatimonadota bacterium]
MRTTLTLDPDVAAELRRLHRSDVQTFKGLVNDLLRLGLRQLASAGEKKPKRKSYTHPMDLGECLIDINDISEALALLEGEDYR